MIVCSWMERIKRRVTLMVECKLLRLEADRLVVSPLEHEGRLPFRFIFTLLTCKHPVLPTNMTLVGTNMSVVI